MQTRRCSNIPSRTSGLLTRTEHTCQRRLRYWLSRRKSGTFSEGGSSRQATATPGQLAGISPTRNEQSHERSGQRALVGLLKKKRRGLFKISSKQRGSQKLRGTSTSNVSRTGAVSHGCPTFSSAFSTEQEEGDEEVKAVQESETVPTQSFLCDSPRERRGWLRSQCQPGCYVCESNKRKVRV